MERSWWIVLVLISNLSYGQVSNGAIANNRFLQRTNPQIDRAIADGGSSLDHPEVQRLARQMVDMDVWNNMTLWMHEGLIKERVSGSDIFVPTAYDISGNVNDAVQTGTSEQPKLDTIGLLYDGSNDFQLLTNDSINTDYVTFMCYFRLNAYGSPNTFLINRVNSYNGTLRGTILTSTTKLQFSIRPEASPNLQASVTSISNISLDTWYHCAFTYGGGNRILYINGVQDAINTIGTPGPIQTSNYQLTMIGTQTTTEQFTNGNISDMRIFDKVLTATQIDAIFQETKAKYGY